MPPFVFMTGSDFCQLLDRPVAHRWIDWSLADLAADQVGDAPRSPFLDPDWCADVLQAESRRLGGDDYAGGYLENRALLWRGSYLRPAAAIHLGVDVSAPAGTVVRAPVPGRVRAAWQDPDGDGGWGGRLILDLDAQIGGHLVLAHLTLRPELPEILQAGDVVGVVAPPSSNGGWFPHLHVQRVAWTADLVELDGYGPAAPDNADRFPNPLPLVLEPRLR